MPAIIPTRLPAMVAYSRQPLFFIYVLSFSSFFLLPPFLFFYDCEFRSVVLGLQQRTIIIVITLVEFDKGDQTRADD